MITLCINLDSRPDRWELAQAEFARVGLTVQRFAAITGDNRPLAFNQSVYECMKMATTFVPKHGVDGWPGTVNYNDLLLFEDDVVFDDKAFETYKPFNPLYYSQDLPEDFMTLHLGSNIIGLDTTSWQMPSFYTNRLSVLHNCYQSHATLYSKKCVDFILANMRADILDEDNNIFDDWLRRKVLSQGKSFVLNPMVCYQRPSESDIWGGVWADYTGAHKAGNEYLKNNL